MLPVSSAVKDLVAGIVSRALTTTPAPWRDGSVQVDVQSRFKRGEVRIDARSIHAGSLTEEDCKLLADLLTGEPEVESAFAAAPHVYVRLQLDVLERAVVGGILSAPSTYGASAEGRDQELIVSFGSPGTNKPLHVGHLRICAVGLALNRILASRGHPTFRFQILSDSGMHIAQAALAYQLWGEGATPGAAQEKPDHFVGRHYAAFHQDAAGEAQPEEAPTPLDGQARELLRRIDDGDPDAVELGNRLSEWAVEGIRQTYRRIGVAHDLELRETETLPLARQLVEAARRDGLCQRRPDGSVYVDLTEHGHGEVTLLRGDGTPLVYAHLLGSWTQRGRLRPDGRLLLVAGDQWRDGIASLFTMLELLGQPEAANAEHVVIGMVKLGQEKLKSRQGTPATVDAILDRLHDAIEATWPPAPGETDRYLRAAICDTLAVGVVKYHLLGVRRQTPLPFDEATLLSQADTFVRVIHTLSRAAARRTLSQVGAELSADDVEKYRKLLAHLDDFGDTVRRAAEALDPSLLVRYVDEMCVLLRAYDQEDRVPPNAWCSAEVVIRRALHLLAVDVPASLRYLPPMFVGPSGLPQAPPPGVTAR